MLPLIGSPAPIESFASSQYLMAQNRSDNRLFLSSVTVAYDGQCYMNARILVLLNEYAALRDNWDEDNGKAPSAKALAQAYYITSLLDKHGQSIYHAAPGPNGEIMLDIRNRKKTKSVEIILYGDRSTVVYFPEQGKPAQKKFDESLLPELLDWVNRP